MSRTSHIRSDVHTHARRGVDFAMDETGILVLALRKGRRFEPEDIPGHVESIKRWLKRWVKRTNVHGLHPILDEESISIYHDNEGDVLVSKFRVWVGFDPDFECYAHTFGEEHDHDDEEGRVVVPILMPKSGYVN